MIISRKARSRGNTYELVACAETASTQPTVVVTDLLSKRQRVAVALLLAVYVVGYANAWNWWLSIHVGVGWSMLDLWITVMAADATVGDLLRQSLLLRAKRIRQDLLPDNRLRVGMVVTKAPSEPWSVLEKTLTGALSQDYPFPYEVWLADEMPSDTTRAWCAEHGVHISTRQGVSEYHQPCWPRRTKCKEGNLAYFYEHYGYERFDVVCQFDADHVPEPDYLTTLMPAFSNPKVGYVALPSICGANREVSWNVRGRLYYEALMHGPTGACLSGIALPCCIGSHYAVRTAALQEVGGIGPELNEDWSTSYIMTSSGHRGLFAIDTIAHGDGPATFEDNMRQEYQWARSAMVLLTVYVRRFWPGRLTLLEHYRVIVCKLHYILISLWALASLVIAVGPGLFGLHLVPNLAYSWDTNMRIIQLFLTPILLGYSYWLLCSYNGWLRPVNAKFWRYETILYSFCKPWWILQGTVHGLLGGMLGINFNIKVTPKGDNGEVFMGLKNLVPFLACATVCLIGLSFGTSHFLLPLITCISHIAAAAAIVALHYKDNHVRPDKGTRFPWRNFLKLTVPTGLLMVALIAVLLLRWDALF